MAIFHVHDEEGGGEGIVDESTEAYSPYASREGKDGKAAAPTLFIVGTPIGNLEDISLRALRILKEVDSIACEDTRMTAKILSHYNVRGDQGNKGRLISYHAQSVPEVAERILSLLEEGKSIALVSDAGTPGISDPGTELVARVRERFAVELAEGSIRIEAVPGPSALTAALSIAGVPCADFVFLGFLPHKKGRQTLFNEIAQEQRTVVLYESPHRIMKTLASLTELLGPEKKVTIVREISKIYEEVLTGTASELAAVLTSNPQKQKGEFVVIISTS